MNEMTPDLAYLITNNCLFSISRLMSKRFDHCVKHNLDRDYVMNALFDLNVARGFSTAVPFLYSKTALNAAVAYMTGPDSIELLLHSPFKYTMYLYDSTQPGRSDRFDSEVTVIGVYFENGPNAILDEDKIKNYKPGAKSVSIVTAVVGLSNKRITCGFGIAHSIIGDRVNNTDGKKTLNLVAPFFGWTFEGIDPAKLTPSGPPRELTKEDDSFNSYHDLNLRMYDLSLCFNNYMFAHGPVIVKESINRDTIKTRVEEDRLCREEPLRWKGMYRVVVPDEAQIIYATPNKHDREGKPLAEGTWVRTHSRTYKSDRYVNKKGQTDIIVSYWRGPKSFESGYIKYVVKSAVDGDKRSPDQVWNEMSED